jgi:hypothetical protein
MTLQARILRLLFVIALAIYLGGFTFYSLVVIPILHERLGSSLETGLVTQRVTDSLNSFGSVTLALGWFIFWIKGVSHVQCGRGRRWYMRTLLASSTCLIVLIALHWVLDRKLETNSRDGFYLWHRAYLWTSTVQWFANIGLLAQSAGLVPPSAELSE